ncbi:MAG: oligosaccharide flippase family protein [Chloroflexi bacterium]|nr:oligosaccharide flippase family protein [Chloroflexota bacterium]
MAGQSRLLMLNHFLATVFFQIDIVILEAMKGERIVGLYRVAYSWLLAINVVPAFYTQALMATMSRQAADDRAALRTTYRMSIKLLVGIALPFRRRIHPAGRAIDVAVGRISLSPRWADRVADHGVEHPHRLDEQPDAVCAGCAGLAAPGDACVRRGVHVQHRHEHAL